MIGDEFVQPYHPPHCPKCSEVTEQNRPFCRRCGFDLRYGSPKSITFGNCIYCEKYRKFSKEHVFPDWIKNHYPRRYSKKRHHLTRPERLAFWEAVPSHSESYDRLGDPYSTVVLNVCEPCNNGWMSNLQNEAKPLVQTLADGQWPDFADVDRELLARWSVMVSINLECHGRMLAATQYQRTTLMKGSMPPGWRISIGLMKDNDCAGESFYRAIGVPIAIGDGEPLRMQSTFYCIERAAFHTLSSFGDNTLRAGLLAGGFSEMRLPTRSLWPAALPADETMGVDLVREDLVGIQRIFGYVE